MMIANKYTRVLNQTRSTPLKNIARKELKATLENHQEQKHELLAIHRSEVSPGR